MSYVDRVLRMDKLTSIVPETKRLHDLMIAIPINEDVLTSLRNSAMIYIARAMNISLTSLDEKSFIESIYKNRNNLKNITPNGAVVPKKEFIIEYNLFLNFWFQAVSPLVKLSSGLISRIRLTPNLRIKFGDEIKENLNRPLNTSLPHSDAWLEGPYSYNCHVPLFGDHNGNFLKFYQPREKKEFREDFLSNAKTYNEMQWVMDFYKDCDAKPNINKINLSDYALLHNTHREKGCSARISIDTTIVTEDFPVHPDRVCEYHEKIPQIGNDRLAMTLRSESDDLNPQKKSVFSHYTTGTLEFVEIDINKYIKN